jgi:UDP-glucose 4-epimerase
MSPKPVSPYGVSKFAAEHYVHRLGDHFRMENVVLRYFNVFGPGQDPSSEYSAVVPRFISSALAGRRPVVNGAGDVSRDFTYVENVVRANLLAGRSDRPSGVTYNIACGSRTTLLGLLEAIGAATDQEIIAIHGPPRAGDIQHSLADITAAGHDLGYEVAVPFDEGIRRTVDWYRKHPGSLSGISH